MRTEETTLDKARPMLSHHITPSPHKPIKGKNTKTDREPMSTSEYKGHMRKYEAHKK